MRVEDADDVVAHHVDNINVSKPGLQLPEHLAPVVGQHGVQLALVVTQWGVPGQDVVSVGQVEYCRKKDAPQNELQRGSNIF